MKLARDIVLEEMAPGGDAGSRVASRQLLLDAAAALQQPSVQPVYTSLAQITSQCGRTPTEWFVGDMASGNMVGVGGTTLTAGPGTIRYQKTVPGWNGTDMTSGHKAVEFVNGASLSQFVAGNTTLLDLDQALTIVMSYRVLRPPAAARGLIGKKASTAAGTAGWCVYLPVSGGLNLIVADGSTQVLVQPPSGITGLDGVMSGAVQWSAFKMNPAGNAQVLGLRGNGTAGAIPAGTKTNSETFKVSGGVAGLQGCECLQILQWGWFVGSEATSFDLDDLNLLDQWCRPHALFSTYVRQSMIAPDVAVDATGVRVQHCHGSTLSTALTHVAHGYHANITENDQKLGLVRLRGSQTSSDTETAGLKKRNRILEGDNFANAAWTKTSITATANAGEDPAGYQGAASLTATADNGVVFQNFTGEVNERHTISVYGQRNQGSDVAGRLQLWDSAGGAEVAGVDITFTALRQRFSLTVDDSLVTMTTLQWRLRLNTNGSSVFATFAQAELDGLTPYQEQRTSLVDRDDDEVDISNTDGSRYDERGGRVEITVVGYADEVRSSGCFIFSADSGASFEDRHFIQRDALTSEVEHEARIYDGAANIVSQLDLTDVTNTDEVTYVSEWEAHRPLPRRAQRAIAEVEGTALVTGAVVATTGWTPGNNSDRLSPGSRIAGDTAAHLAHLEGLVVDLKIWGRL